MKVTKSKHKVNRNSCFEMSASPAPIIETKIPDRPTPMLARISTIRCKARIFRVLTAFTQEGM
ncbi:hypothetical protein D3C84_1281610 [compost metagenome]